MTESERFQNLLEKEKGNKERKIRMEERLENAKKELKRVVGEIKEAGYDHRTLKSDLESKRKELTKELDQFDKDVQAQTEALDSIEG